MNVVRLLKLIVPWAWAKVDQAKGIRYGITARMEAPLRSKVLLHSILKYLLSIIRGLFQMLACTS
jgi:hypothetical protein